MEIYSYSHNGANWEWNGAAWEGECDSPGASLDMSMRTGDWSGYDPGEEIRLCAYGDDGEMVGELIWTKAADGE